VIGLEIPPKDTREILPRDLKKIAPDGLKNPRGHYQIISQSGWIKKKSKYKTRSPTHPINIQIKQMKFQAGIFNRNADEIPCQLKVSSRRDFSGRDFPNRKLRNI
jgi:hypothetical protein